MEEKTVIFIGKSGCGKGTQIKTISNFLINKGINSIDILESGQVLRDFISSDSYTSNKTKEYNIAGKLYPTFIAIWSWVDKMIKTFNGQQIIFVDGAPRKLNEAVIMNEMFDFYERENRHIVILNVSDDWAAQRLHERKRGDDLNEKAIQTRLGWFKENSDEVISYFKELGNYKIHIINGENKIEDVANEIIEALEL